jgi:hypothetical protein
MVPSGRPAKGAGGGEQSGTRASKFGLAGGGRVLVALGSYISSSLFSPSSSRFEIGDVC